MLTATRFDVNVSILFTEHPLPERPSAAADAGFEAGGYPGYVGLESRSSRPTVDSFDWLPRDRRASLTGARRQTWGGTR